MSDTTTRRVDPDREDAGEVFAPRDPEAPRHRRRVPAAAVDREGARRGARGFPTRLIAITWTDGICPPEFYPTGAAGPLPATLPFTLQPLATWASKMIVLRHATKQQSPSTST